MMTASAPSASRGPHGLLAGIDVALAWVVRLVWLNLWWLLLSLAGGIVLGVGPATVAAHEVASTWVRGRDVDSVPRSMASTWRRCWWPANRTAVITAAMVGALVLTWLLSRSHSPLLAASAQGVCLMAGLVMVAVTPHLIWLSAAEARERRRGFTPGLARVFTAALAVVVARPILTAALALAWIAWPALLVSTGWPGLLPVCGASVPLLANAWCLARVSIAPEPEDEDSAPRSVPAHGTTTPERI